MKQGAEFSECRKYRYALWRVWDEMKPLVMFIGLNPSTANADTDDPTIQSVTRISKHNGYGGFYMMNLYGIISPDPNVLKVVDDPMGHNIEWLAEIQTRCSSVVFAWGNFKEAKEVSRQHIFYYDGALCIGQNKNGTPKHPLYQKADSILKPFQRTTN